MPRLPRAALLPALALAVGCAHPTTATLTSDREPAPRPELPTRSHLAVRAHQIDGPRVMFAERVHGRALTMYGTATARTRVLVAGCVNGTTCAGTDAVNTDLIGCPPPDAELWHFPTLAPNGADLDATPDHPGAQAFRQATADLRPAIAITFRTGTKARVHAAGADERPARRFARLARLPFGGTRSQGLAAWAAAVLPGTAGITVELPPGRASRRAATRLAYAIDRLAGTRFADGALQDRRRMIASGLDPRESRH
ncbi:MAG TPA: hypothetical protein VFZ00_21600 [Solirubrobacter sp.]|nr:hypothetical protein [Solirubrobacter sp.]